MQTFRQQMLQCKSRTWPCDWSFPCAGANQRAQEVTAPASASDPRRAANFPPVRLSGISSVLPYDELSASYGDLKLSKDGEKKKGGRKTPWSGKCINRL